MRLCAVSLLLVVITAGAPDQKYDVLRLKSGRELTGFIVSETKEAIKFRIVILGNKGQTSGGITALFKKTEIESVARASDKARDTAKERSRAAASRPLDYETALQKLMPMPVRFMHQDAIQINGKHFEVVSTCDDRFVREVTFYLEEVYKAYRRTFGVKRDADRRVTVYLLKDFKEYTRFQVLKFGGAIRNPAFYNIQGNFVAAYDLYPEEKAREIRTRVLRYERKAREYRKEAKAWEDRIRKEAIAIRSKIGAEARQASNAIRADRYGDKNSRLRKVELWKERQQAIVRGQERKAKQELKDYRAEATAYIARNRKVLAHNYRFRLVSNKRMFEFLFHEGFHAFSRNFLWKDGRRSVPRWIEEGLASYYEMSAVEVGELIHGGSHPLFLALLQKQRAGLLPLEQIVKGDHRQFVVTHRNDEDRSNLYYAQSWMIAHYLVARVPQQRILAYIRSVVSGADPVKAFELLMGAPIRRVESDIKAYLAKLGR